MTIYATFVGVNKHEDLNINELSGAVTDAKAVYALFSDSITALESKLLLDEAATIDTIKHSIFDHKEKVTNEDTVLFYFSGHGSEDHRLIPYDTCLNDLSNSTIRMDELSEWINGQQARTVIILDCCFSGGAAAKVLHGAPISQDNFSTIEELQGAGRVIITASQSNQAAIETNGQGIFTKSLLDIFISTDGDVSLGYLIDELSNRVRSEAERFGVPQRPTIYNYIEDSFIFPALNPGLLFKEQFPDTTRIVVSSDINELTAFGLPIELTNVWQNNYPNGLNELQLSSVNEYRVLDGQSLLTVAPTSAGKTFIGEMALAKAISQGKKAIFLLPYRALTNEKYEDFNEIYGNQLGYRVIRCTGDFSDSTNTYMLGQYDIALLTYEMFLTLSLSAPERLSLLGLVVIDEAQFVTDKTRGINVELLLTNLILQRQNGIEPQIVALSAVIGDTNHFDEWLNCKLLQTDKRPIPLIEGVIDRRGTFQYLDIDGIEKEDQLLSPHQIVQRGNKPSSQDIIVPLAQKLIPENERLIVFRNSKGATSGCANYLANSLGLPPAHGTIDEITGFDPSNSTSSLIRALQGGTCFHNANLNRNERIAVEKAFKSNDGNVKAMAATTTVAAGVNTPASTVIIAEAFFFSDNGKIPFSVAEYKNMAGRAGRFGISDKGRSVIIADSPRNRTQLFDRYVKGNPEPIDSSFHSNDMDTWVLRLLSQVNVIPRSNAINLLSNTFGGYLLNRENPNWANETEHTLTELLDKMISLNLVEQMGDNINLTLLGKACGKSSLSFQSVMMLVEKLKHLSGQLSAIELVGLIQILPEVSRYTPLMKRGNKESQWIREVSSYYGRKITSEMQSNAQDNWEYYARCKRAAILYQWINGTPMETIESTFSANPFSGTIGAGDVRGFADITRLYLKSASDIAALLLLDEGPDAIEVDQLLLQLETGLPKEALGLVEVSAPLLRGEYLSLFHSGLITAEQVMSLSKEEILKHVGAINFAYLDEIANEFSLSE